MSTGTVQALNSMSTSYFQLLDRERKERLQKLRKLYAPRRPMAQLPDEYRVTSKNPEPPLVHFAFPINDYVLYKYAEKHNLSRYFPCAPDWLSPTTMVVATGRLSEEVEYELEFGFPLRMTADCDVIVGLYSNYSIKEKKLIEEDEEDVIRMVQEELGLEKSVRPKWYFDFHDSWVPEDSDVEGTEEVGLAALYTLRL